MVRSVFFSAFLVHLQNHTWDPPMVLLPLSCSIIPWNTCTWVSCFVLCISCTLTKSTLDKPMSVCVALLSQKQPPYVHGSVSFSAFLVHVHNRKAFVLDAWCVCTFLRCPCTVTKLNAKTLWCLCRSSVNRITTSCLWECVLLRLPCTCANAAYKTYMVWVCRSSVRKKPSWWLTCSVREFSSRCI